MRLLAIVAVLSACGVDPAPVRQKVQFLVDPASQMCMPIVTCDHDDGNPGVVGCAGGPAEDPPSWMGWASCTDPCAGRSEAECKLDPRCLPRYQAPPPIKCPPNAACLPTPPPTYVGCDPNPSTDPCLGLDEKTCGATPGCRPIYGGVPCDCGVQPDGTSPPCACPEIAAYRGCAGTASPPRCVGDAECGPGAHCSTDDGDCGPPPGCAENGVCPAVCGGVCVPDDDCKPDASGACRSSCAAIGDERTCVARADCEPVYVGSRCFCDPQGCGCLDYTFDACRPRPLPPPTCVPTEIQGAWSSDLAPRRVYTFNKDGSFAVSDAIAPCPKDALCIWSGILVNQGKWFVDASGAIGLAYQALQKADGLVFPTTLTLKGCLLVEADTGRVFSR
jgi:hypothetical protein